MFARFVILRCGSSIKCKCGGRVVEENVIGKIDVNKVDKQD